MYLINCLLKFYKLVSFHFFLVTAYLSLGRNKWTDLKSRQLELAALDRKQRRALTKKACSTFEVDRRQRLAAIRERRNKNISQIPTTTGVPCPTCNRMCVSVFGLRSHVILHNLSSSCFERLPRRHLRIKDLC